MATSQRTAENQSDDGMEPKLIYGGAFKWKKRETALVLSKNFCHITKSTNGPWFLTYYAPR